MAKKNAKEAQFNYQAAIGELKSTGPERLYLLRGPEDYLREQYLAQLKRLCLPEGEDSFSYRRINGPELSAQTLGEALDAMPFMTQRSFLELRDVDINRLSEPEACLKLLSDIPDYCTAVFVQSAGYEPDGRQKTVKALRELAHELNFTRQSQGLLTDWIVKRFSAAGKSVELEAVQRLLFVSGNLMNRLIPEIEKVAAYAAGEKVTAADVDAVANHIPEADIFEMTEFIAQKKNNSAASILAELLSDRNNEPIAILAALGGQMRKLYAARLALERGLGAKYVMEACALKYDFIATKLLSAARGYTLPQLIRAVELCCEADYRIKSSGEDDGELLKETVMRIAAGEGHA